MRHVSVIPLLAALPGEWSQAQVHRPPLSGCDAFADVAMMAGPDSWELPRPTVVLSKVRSPTSCCMTAARWRRARARDTSLFVDNASRSSHATRSSRTRSLIDNG